MIARKKSAKPRPTLTTPGFVYFAQDEDCTKIKIGFTTNPRSRLSWLNTCESRLACPGRKILFIGFIVGTMSTEHALQWRFRSERLPDKREWFVEGGKVRRYINRRRLLALNDIHPKRKPPGRPLKKPVENLTLL